MKNHQGNLPGRALEAGAAAAVEATVRAGAILYRRSVHLPRLLRLFPSEIPTEEPAATRFIVARLGCAARQERRRARSGHWAYDLNRHIALMQALAAERRHLARETGPAR